MANMTGMHNQIKISIPGNQMFITFESNSTIFAKKGFKAFINEIGMYWLITMVDEKRNPNYVSLLECIIYYIMSAKSTNNVICYIGG